MKNEKPIKKGDIGAQRIERAPAKKFPGASDMTAKKAGWKPMTKHQEFEQPKSF